MIGYDDKGFTLIELVIVIAIIGILAAIAIPPSYVNYLDKNRRSVCETNRIQLKRQLSAELVLYNSLDTPNAIKEFLDDFMHEHGNNICPSGGIIEQKNVKFICLVHQRLKITMMKRISHICKVSFIVFAKSMDVAEEKSVYIPQNSFHLCI